MPYNIIGAFLILLASNWQAFAGTDGPEFQVNTHIAGDQEFASVAALRSGGFVVVWESDRQDGSLFGVYGQLYSAAGTRVGDEFRVNTTVADHQELPQVAALANGGFVVTWESFRQDGSETGVYGQRYTARARPLGPEFRVNSRTSGDQYAPDVAGLKDGGFVITWTSGNRNSSNNNVYGQRYDPRGRRVGNEFRINTFTAGFQGRSSIAVLKEGGFVVAWISSNQDGSESGVYGQRYHLAGMRDGSEFQINTHTRHSPGRPSIAALKRGGFVVTWEAKQNGFFSDWNVYGQRFTAGGKKAGLEFRANTYTRFAQLLPSVAPLEDGGFVVIWYSFQDPARVPDIGDEGGIYGQRYNAEFRRMGREFRVNTTTENEQYFPSVAALNSGAYVAVWHSFLQDRNGRGVVGRIFSP